MNNLCQHQWLIEVTIGTDGNKKRPPEEEKKAFSVARVVRKKGKKRPSVKGRNVLYNFNHDMEIQGKWWLEVES